MINMTAWVLIVVSSVHNGQVVSMQEFDTKKACDEAAKIIMTGEHRVRWSPVYTYCTPKGAP